MSIENLQKSRPVKTKTKAKHKVNKRHSSPYFHIGMGLFLLLVMFLGFWSSYFSAVLPGREMEASTGGVPAVIHIHGLVFVGWFLLYMYQSILIFKKKIITHNKIGRYGMFLGAAVFITGLLVLFFQQYKLISDGDRTLTEGTFGTVGVWMQMLSFAVLLFLGYKKRRLPESHNRYMLFATIVIMPAALVRTLSLDFIRNSISIPSPLFFGLLILAVVWIHDYYTLRKIHKVTLIGTGLLIIDMALLYMGFA